MRYIHDIDRINLFRQFVICFCSLWSTGCAGECKFTRNSAYFWKYSSFALLYQNP